MNTRDMTVKHWRLHAIGAGLVVALIGAVYGVVVRPRLEAGARAAEARRELAEVRAEAEISMTRAKNAQTLAEKLTAEAAQQKIELLPASKLNERVAVVSAVAEKLGLRILELVPGNESTEASHVHFPIKLRGVGPASAGPALLRDLHAAYPDLAVVGVTIRANPADAAEQTEAAGKPARAEALVSVDFEWYAVGEAAGKK
ncbi:MAG: hypothetical protein HEQ23_09190 [Tepidisphaera sp.]